MASGRWLCLDVLAVEHFGLIVCAAGCSHCGDAALLASTAGKHCLCGTLALPVAPTTGSASSSTDAYPAYQGVGVVQGMITHCRTPPQSQA